MQVKDKTAFKSQVFYNLTSQIQSNTLLNRGLLDIGGIAVPQMAMSNNKDEAIERGSMSGLYFAASFLAPFVLLPFFNKVFLSQAGITKNFKTSEKRIIEVSKEYLVKDSKFLVDGIRKTAEKIEQKAFKKGKNTTIKKDFENILTNFDGKIDVLKDKMIKAHENIYSADYICTGLMFSAVPWLATEITKLRTKRSGYSATYSMIDENKSSQNAKSHESQKKKKLLASLLIAVVPGIIVPKLVTKGLTGDSKFLNFIKKNPANFNYKKGIYPSKAIFALMWFLCDFPSTVVSARDKYERKDRILRSSGMLSIFFFGDSILNNVLGRFSDRVFKTKIMDRSKITEKTGFIKKAFMQPKTFEQIEDLQGVSKKILNRTKRVGAGLYWVTLLANMGLLGFGLPAFLNKVLKTNVKKDSLLQENKKL